MSAYLVLARKWRPQGFATLIGQEHVTRSLINALGSGRLAHAFLFTGIRGVGKTTLARVLAMCLNCETGPTATPCGTCDSCLEIRTGSHPDVLEIDAASRTKVDQMREVLEMVRYTPASARFKVYILDEVHMLTTQSFNALLKTLEEPPAHVKFIFATTESRRLPATILSRCQRYDLKRVPRPVMQDHLAHILATEKVTWDEAGLAAVVRAADGSVRDALSILDQAIAHGNGAVLFENVRHLLGLTDRDAVIDLLAAVTEGSGDKVLQAIQAFFVGGLEPDILVNDLLELLHLGVRSRVLRQESRSEPPALDLEPAPPFLDNFPLEHLQMLYQVLLRGRGDLQVAASPYQALEMLLLRVTYLRQAPDLRQLILKMSGGGEGNPGRSVGADTKRPAEGVENSGQPARARLNMPGGGEGNPGQSVGAGTKRPAEGEDNSGQSARARLNMPGEGEGNSSRFAGDDRGLSGGGERNSSRIANVDIKVSGEAATVLHEDGRVQEAIANADIKVSGEAATVLHKDGGMLQASAATIHPEKNRTGSMRTLASWEDFLTLTTRNSPSLARRLGGQVACLKFCAGTGGIPETIHLRLTHDCFGPAVRLQQMLAEFLLQQGFGGTRLIVEEASLASRPESWQESQERQTQEHKQTLTDEIREHPVIRHLMEVFQAEIVAVEPLAGEA
ncbi:MAG: DNA polymerase III subunit gamma/tau [Magnetococcales bacterium]|nr:DNA polymerase III subunit gamma/tau [Magnetococcales bacterium]